jgi:hypothetical protein
MNRNWVMTLAILLLLTVNALGQKGITGRWQTDNVPGALAAQAVGGRGAGGQAIMLDLRMEGNKVRGTVREIGNSSPMTIETGTMEGNIVTLVMQSRGLTWKLELTDDNTLTLKERVITARDNTFSGNRGRSGAPVVFHRAK